MCFSLQISPFFIKDLKAKYDKQNEVLEKLGLAGQQREAAELTSTSKKRYDNLHACLCVWGASQFSRLVPNPEENIRIFVDNKFKLSEVFEEWHNNWRSKNPDPTFLFCDINEDNVARFLVPMKVAFRRGQYIVHPVISFEAILQVLS